MKLYKKILKIISIIIILPLILFVLIIFGMAIPFITINNRRIYRKSAYYKTFKLPFKNNIYDSCMYSFYNYATRKNLPIKYIKKDRLEYFIYNDEVYIFPDFNDLRFSEETQCWEVVYRKYKEESRYQLDEYMKKKKELLEEHTNKTVKLLISRYYFGDEYLDLSTLPKYLHVIRKYDSAFEEKDKEMLAFIPENTEQLYEMMNNNSRLGGKVELKSDGLIVWTFENVCYSFY